MFISFNCINLLRIVYLVTIVYSVSFGVFASFARCNDRQLFHFDVSIDDDPRYLRELLLPQGVRWSCSRVFVEKLWECDRFPCDNIIIMAVLRVARFADRGFAAQLVVLGLRGVGQFLCQDP